MKSFSLYLFVLLPILHTPRLLCEKCEKIQSVINLEPSATTSNFTHAIIADGKYYLLSQKETDSDEVRAAAEWSGDMPTGFDDSRLTIVIDGTDCSKPHYYLLTFKSFPYDNNKGREIFYSTLNLVGWTPESKWTKPRLIRNNSLLGKDPYILMVTQLNSIIPIEDFIQTILYSHKMKTYYFVTKPIASEPTTPLKSTSLRYYSAQVLNPCDQICFYSRTTENLSLALNSVIEPLDLCFFDESGHKEDYPLIYCFGGQSFRMNAVVSRSKNGSLRTVSIDGSHQLPTIDRLKVVGSVCTLLNDKSAADVPPIGLRSGHNMDAFDAGLPDNNLQASDQTADHSKDELKTESPNPDSHTTTIIVVVVVLVIVALVVFVLLMGVRKQQRIAKM